MSMHSALNAKHGPLKTWQWGGLIASAVVLGLILRSRSQAKAASSNTVDPATSDQGPIDPWTGIPYSQEGLGAGGAPGVSGSGDAGVPADQTVPVTMDPPDWYNNPPPWWTAPGVPDNSAGEPSGGTDAGAGANSAVATHVAVSPVQSRPSEIHSNVRVDAHGNPASGAGSHATSGTPQPTHNSETYSTIVKDHKVYHYYPERHGPTQYVYIRPASH